MRAWPNDALTAANDRLADPRCERALCEVLLAARDVLPRHRLRTRLSVRNESLRLWRERWGGEPSDEVLHEAFGALLERLLGRGFLAIGGPTDKRVLLTSAGKEHAAQLLAKA